MTIGRRDNHVIIGDLSEEEKATLDKIFESDIYLVPKSEKILPRPVICDGKGKLTKDYSTRDWFLKLQEEIFEVMEAEESGRDDEFDEIIAEELADVITVCISYLNAHGNDEKARSEIFRRVNEKNEKRGYFKETD